MKKFARFLMTGAGVGVMFLWFFLGIAAGAPETAVWVRPVIGLLWFGFFVFYLYGWFNKWWNNG